MAAVRGAGYMCGRSCSLHLVQHRAERLLYVQRLFDLVGRDERILPVLHETRAMVLADELDERRHVRLPIFWKALEILKRRIQTGLRKERDGIVGVLGEVGIENALIHKICFTV